MPGRPGMVGQGPGIQKGDTARAACRRRVVVAVRSAGRVVACCSSSTAQDDHRPDRHRTPRADRQVVGHPAGARASAGRVVQQA